MDYEFRVVVEKVLSQQEEVIKRDTLKIYDIEKPESIVWGCANRFYSKVQSAFSMQLTDWSSAQSVEQTLQVHAIEIPRCFCDHKLRLQKHCCKNQTVLAKYTDNEHGVCTDILI